LVGAELPPIEEGATPFKIKLGKLRGVESQGMLCSARELKLAEDHGGLLIWQTMHRWEHPFAITCAWTTTCSPSSSPPIWGTA